jgi:hypothetical protein
LFHPSRFGFYIEPELVCPDEKGVTASLLEKRLEQKMFLLSQSYFLVLFSVLFLSFIDSDFPVLIQIVPFLRLKVHVKGSRDQNF